MRGVARKKTLARQMAGESAKHVLSESTRAAREIARALREADPELHGRG